MTTIDDIPWGEPVGDAIQLAKPRRCNHRNQPRVSKNIAPDGAEPVWAITCGRCGHVFDPEKQKQGKSSNNIAKDIERWAGRILRLTRVGQYGGQADLGTEREWALAQVKSGPQWFLPKMAAEIEALQPRAGQQRMLVVAEKPGSTGKPRRGLAIMLLDELPLPGAVLIWQESHGKLTCEVCAGLFPYHEEWCIHAVH